MRYRLQEMSVTKSQPVFFICIDASHPLTFLSHRPDKSSFPLFILLSQADPLAEFIYQSLHKYIY